MVLSAEPCILLRAGTVVRPLPQANMPSEPPRDAAPQAGAYERSPRAILVVEDSDDFRLMLAAFLGGRGFEVACAKTGTEAVEAVRGRRPDLVLMDLGLPEVDGLSAAREIRELPRGAALPILILSAYDSVEFRAEALEAGCVGYLVKPVDPEALLRTVELLLGRGGGGEVAAA